MTGEACRRDADSEKEAGLSRSKMEALAQFGELLHDGVRKSEESKKTHRF